MRTPDLISLAASFAQFNAKKLLFTRLDETACMGPLLSIALFSGYRLSLFSTGQQIPESLVPASADFIFANLGAGQKTAQQAA
jgi:flagellar biosynthesis protein FlhF